MIGGCITSGKYNMVGRLYTKTTEQNTKTGQMKAAYHSYRDISLIARGLANLRGKDTGTEQDWGNRLDEYHYLRVKTSEKMEEGDILTRIKDQDGKYYLDSEIQFVVIGITPTYEPFGSFMEYDIICNKADVNVKLESELVVTELMDSIIDYTPISSSETSSISWELYDDFERADGALGNGWSSFDGTGAADGFIMSGVGVGGEDTAYYVPESSVIHGSFTVPTVPALELPWVLLYAGGGTTTLSDAMGLFMAIDEGDFSIGASSFRVNGEIASLSLAPLTWTPDSLYEFEYDKSSHVKIWRDGTLVVTLSNSSPGIEAPPDFPYTNELNKIVMIGEFEEINVASGPRP